MPSSPGKAEIHGRCCAMADPDGAGCGQLLVIPAKAGIQRLCALFPNRRASSAVAVLGSSFPRRRRSMDVALHLSVTRRSSSAAAAECLFLCWPKETVTKKKWPPREVQSGDRVHLRHFRTRPPWLGPKHACQAGGHPCPPPSGSGEGAGCQIKERSRNLVGCAATMFRLCL